MRHLHAGKIVADRFVKEWLREKPMKAFEIHWTKQLCWHLQTWRKPYQMIRIGSWSTTQRSCFGGCLELPGVVMSISRTSCVMSLLQFLQRSSTMMEGWGRSTKLTDLAQKLESNCENVVASLPQAPDATSSAYIFDWMAFLQSLNENHFHTFNDLAEVVQNGIVRLLQNLSLSLISLIIVSSIDTIIHLPSNVQKENDVVHIRSKPIRSAVIDRYPTTESFWRDPVTRQSLLSTSLTYIIGHVAEYLPHHTSVVLAGGLVKQR